MSSSKMISLNLGVKKIGRLRPKQDEGEADETKFLMNDGVVSMMASRVVEIDLADYFDIQIFAEVYIGWKKEPF